ncbi:MAG: redox-sensing transcriptional repressor Rex [Treponema sp.]|uniref:redox-sensing transcriptional repressor Rex n=1 Tax=Treponema sp. TaxID=166 RepID=UPI003FA1CF2F
MKRIKIPAVPSIRRLPSYLHIVKQAQADGNQYISGTVIAEELHLEPIQVRKDLAITGIIGKPKKGYPVDELVAAIEHFLRWDIQQKAILIGAGNLGTALTGYQGFRDHGLDICAAFDNDKKKIGKKIHGIPIFGMKDLAEQIQVLQPALAILTAPSPSAQTIANQLIEAGIDAIWNFTNVKIKAPAEVLVQQEDLTSGYALLGVMMNTRM